MKSFAQVKGFAFRGKAECGKRKAECRMQNAESRVAGWGWLDMEVRKVTPDWPD
jgi:hypothetical protein